MPIDMSVQGVAMVESKRHQIKDTPVVDVKTFAEMGLELKKKRGRRRNLKS
jgi:hypothetical protein